MTEEEAKNQRRTAYRRADYSTVPSLAVILPFLHLRPHRQVVHPTTSACAHFCASLQGSWMHSPKKTSQNFSQSKRSHVWILSRRHRDQSRLDFILLSSQLQNLVLSLLLILLKKENLPR